MAVVNDLFLFQIVAFLNDLYLALDNILGNYDVFKVSSVTSKLVCRLLPLPAPARETERPLVRGLVRSKLTIHAFLNKKYVQEVSNIK